ncbi:MAG: hypothetical protein QOJ86_5448 [Bradyrhizobium sp.]|jgi:hypothetical protein|nr:hypothetical protein [Bradyrhizobium sp.]
MAALAYASAVVAVRRVPRRFGDLSERGGQLADIVALQRVDDPAVGRDSASSSLLMRRSGSFCMLIVVLSCVGSTDVKLVCLALYYQLFNA